MTTLWERLKFAVATDVDMVMTKKEEKNPLAALNRFIAEAQKQTETTGKWVERQLQLTAKLEQELAEASAMAEKRQAQLGLAKASGESDLSRFAELEVASYSKRVTELQQSLTENLEEITRLEQRFEEMQHKVKDMKLRQLQLMGKENAARAHHQMDKVLASGFEAEHFGAAGSMSAFIDGLGTEAEESHQHSTMEHRLESLEKNSAQQKEIG
ncbi:MAG TPA: PspA/IM30 family protein [Planococcus sp. (in: firmicutes)]|nr:PspA/IM30 family protein [Planococcus sp. (in: firmicutes)]